MKSVAGKIIFAALSVLYPALVFLGLRYGGLTPRVLSIALLVLALFHLSSFSRLRSLQKIDALKGGLFFILTLACGSTAFAFDSNYFLMFYPVTISICMLAFFGISLIRKPCVIFRLASITDKRIENSPSRKFIEDYCIKVTKVWCLFFILNGSIATATVIHGDEQLWALYNGLISYIFMGFLFAVEFLCRKRMQHKHPI